MDALKASLPGHAHLAFHNAGNRKLGMRLCIKTFQLARAQLVRQQLSWCMALHSLRALKELVSVWYSCVQNRARERERAIFRIYKVKEVASRKVKGQLYCF